MGSARSDRPSHALCTRRSPAFLLIFAAGVATAFLPACSQSDRGPSAPSNVEQRTGKYNVILISLDTLRADRLGCYGYHRDTSPSIDALAERGVRFANMISEAPWTAPSTMTLFTGLYPTTHGVRNIGDWVSKKIPTLPEVLQRHGYRTFAYTGGGCLTKYAGFGRGFERYFVKDRRGLGQALEHAKEQLLDFRPDERFFLFIHAYDLHSPYEAGEPHASMFVSPDAESFENWGRNEIVFKEEGLRLSQENIKFLSDHYDGGIRRADSLLKGFFELLEQRDLFANTVVVFLSDHGEEFGEHGFVGHRKIYRECLSPPLIIVAPGLDARVVEHGVGLKDVMPTILDWVGIPTPPCQGYSLRPLLTGEAMAPWPLFSELDSGSNFRSLIWDQRHLIIKAYSEHPLLFDWRTDPTEQVNIADANPEIVASMKGMFPELPESFRHPDVTSEREQRERIRQLYEQRQSPVHLPSSIPESPEAIWNRDVSRQAKPEQIKQLQSLGYVGSSTER